jgi:hypothetical protein
MQLRPDSALPPVDERLVMPESGYEVVDGQVVRVSPADPPHASRHSKVSALLEAYVVPGYDAARTSALGDMAPPRATVAAGSSAIPEPASVGRRYAISPP